MKILSLIFFMALATAVQATPNIETWQTENGAKVLFVPATEIPMMDVTNSF